MHKLENFYILNHSPSFIQQIINKMGRGRDLTVDSVRKVKICFQNNMKPKEIHQLYGFSLPTISRIKNGKLTSNPAKKKKRGRPQKVSQKQARRLTRFAKKNPTMSSSDITKNLDLQINPSTTRRYLKKMNFKNKKIANKVPLNKKHMKQRLEFAKTHLENGTNPSTIIWSDEKRF